MKKLLAFVIALQLITMLFGYVMFDTVFDRVVENKVLLKRCFVTGEVK